MDIVTNRGRGLGKSVQAERHDDEDAILLAMEFIYFFLMILQVVSILQQFSQVVFHWSVSDSKFEWQQVSSSLHNSSQCSGRSK